MDGRKISADDLPQAVRAEVESDVPLSFEPGRRSGRRFAPLLSTALSVLAVGALAVSAASELGSPIPSPRPSLGSQTIGTSEVSAAEVAEISPPRTVPRSGAISSSKKARGKGSKTRHVTLSFGAPQQGSTPSANANGAPTAEQPHNRSGDKKKEERREKVQEVEAEFAIPTTELIHIHKIGTGEHFYSIDRAECERRYEDGYIYRGVVGLVFDRQVEGTVPLRTDDGIAAYIWADAGDDRLPVHYFRGPGSDQKRDYFTSSETDREDYVARGWTYLGIVGYVSAR